MKNIFAATFLFTVLASPVSAANFSLQPVVVQQGGSMSTLQHAYRATDIIGASLVNEKHESLGEVSDLLVNQRDYIPYAIIRTGGFLGLGGKLVAIPYDDLSVSNGKLLLHVTRAQLMAKPKFRYID